MLVCAFMRWSIETSTDADTRKHPLRIKMTKIARDAGNEQKWCKQALYCGLK